MAVDYTTTELVNRVKRRITVPTSQNFFLPENIVNYANDEMFASIINAIVSVQQEYFVTSTDSPVVSGTALYRIPARAAGGMLRDVVMVDVNGNEVNVPHLTPEVVKSPIFSHNSGPLSGMLVKDDSVELIPDETPFTTFSIRFKFMRRPNDLVISSKAAKITSVNLPGNQVVVQSVPSLFTTGLTYDIIRGTPIFTSAGDDLVVTNIAGNTITFAALPPLTAVGSYVSEAGTTPIPQVPYEAHQALAALTAATMLDATGDKKNAEVIYAKGKDMLDGFLKLITPRIEGSQIKVNNRNGIFSQVGRSGFFGW